MFRTSRACPVSSLRVRHAFAGRSGLLALAAGALVALAAPPVRAEQFILMDGTWDYTWDDAVNSKPSKSHYYVNDSNFMNKNRPRNWLTPVDYRNGTLHVRAEVFKKPPGTQTTGWTLCYIANVGGYGCADTNYYTATGVWEREVKMTEWWNNSQLQWDQGVKQLDLIYAINDSGSGHISNYPALKDLTTPTRVRITMVQVSAGAKYDPSILATIGITGDGGTDASVADAGAGADTGGSATGSGGVSGSGGAMVVSTGGATGSGSGGASGATGGTSGSGSTGTGGATTPPTGNPSTGAVTGASGCAIAAGAAGGRAALGVGLGLGLGLLASVRRRRRSR